MPTVIEILGEDEYKYLKNKKNVSDDDIEAIAQNLADNPPPQIEQIPQVEEPQLGLENVPAWYKGQTDSGLINFAGDFTRELGTTAFNYANMMPFGDEWHEKNTKILQKLEAIEEQNKAKGRTPERQAEVDALQLEASEADGVFEKVVAGGKSLYDTATHPKEISVGGTVGMFVNPSNFFYAGKTLLTSIMLGNAVAGVEAGGNALARTDKDLTDAGSEALVGMAANTGIGVGVHYGAKGLARVAKKPAQDVPSAVEKVDKDGYLIDPFDTGDADVRMSPQDFKELVVKEEVDKSFVEFIENTATANKELDVQIKEFGKKLKERGVGEEHVEIAIANAFPPTPDAKLVTDVLNDGFEMTPRLNGLNIQEAIINSIKESKKSPDMFYEAMKKHGATDEHANVATKAYVDNNIMFYTEWAAQKLENSKDMFVDIQSINLLADEAVALHVEEQVDIQNQYKVYTKDIYKELEQLKTHERYNEALEYSRNVKAEDGISPQHLDQPRKVTPLDDGTAIVEGATYEPNTAHDFFLTEAKIKRIEDGKATPSDIEDLKTDIRTLEENPTYAKTPTHVEVARFEELSDIHVLNDAQYVEFIKLQQKYDAETFAEAREMFSAENNVNKINEDADNISKSNTKDIQSLSNNMEIVMGKDADGNDIVVKYGDIEAELDAEAAIIKRIEDCVL